MMVAEETNTFAAFSHRKSGIQGSNQEDTRAHETEAYTGILICLGVTDLPALEYSF
jgi:hypothetical protein